REAPADVQRRAPRAAARRRLRRAVRDRAGDAGPDEVRAVRALACVLVLGACGWEQPLGGLLHATGSVSVTVRERGRPVGDVPVVFQSADGSESFAAVTASDTGTCGHDLEGFVTVLL